MKFRVMAELQVEGGSPAIGSGAGRKGKARRPEKPADWPTLRYFNELLMSVNFVLRLVPRPLTTAIIASEMPAAIRPYSIAVAPTHHSKTSKENASCDALPSQFRAPLAPVLELEPAPQGLKTNERRSCNLPKEPARSQKNRPRTGGKIGA